MNSNVPSSVYLVVSYEDSEGYNNVLLFADLEAAEKKFNELAQQLYSCDGVMVLKCPVPGSLEDGEKICSAHG